MSQNDISWPMVHRIEDAASKFGHEADRIEAAAQRMAAMFEDGYGGNGLRLIDLLESAQSSESAQQRDAAWAELREIRNAINANAEESSLDEVRRVVAQRDELLSAAEYALEWMLQHGLKHKSAAVPYLLRAIASAKGACVQQSTESETQAGLTRTDDTQTAAPAIVFYPAGSLGEAIEEGDTDGGSRAGYECPVCRQCDCLGCNEGGAQ